MTDPVRAVCYRCAAAFTVPQPPDRCPHCATPLDYLPPAAPPAPATPQPRQGTLEL